MLSASSAGDDIVLAADPLDQPQAHAADDQRAHLVGMVERQHGADAAAHRIAHDVDAAEPEMVDEIGGVAGQRRQAVLRRGR